MEMDDSPKKKFRKAEQRPMRPTRKAPEPTAIGNSSSTSEFVTTPNDSEVSLQSDCVIDDVLPSSVMDDTIRDNAVNLIDTDSDDDSDNEEENVDDQYIENVLYYNNQEEEEKYRLLNHKLETKASAIRKSLM
jgi:hypothetical protein